MTKTLDRRLNAYRADLADEALAGRVDADRFVAGEPARVIAPVADVKVRPDRASGTDTQLLLGEPVRVFERKDGWCWLQADGDGYVGYVEETAIGSAGTAATHIVAVPRTFLYPGPDVKFPPVAALSAGSRLTVAGEAETRGTGFLMLGDGSAVIARHCLPAGNAVSSDYVSIAAQFLGTPYLWGGKSGFGIDCSGIVQLALTLAGRSAPRDSDMQAAGLGRQIDPEPGLERGDLVFWKGHVGMLEDAGTLLHASGYAMQVVREPLAEAIERIAALYGPPTIYRRP